MGTRRTWLERCGTEESPKKRRPLLSLPIPSSSPYPSPALLPSASAALDALDAAAATLEPLTTAVQIRRPTPQTSAASPITHMPKCGKASMTPSFGKQRPVRDTLLLARWACTDLRVMFADTAQGSGVRRRRVRYVRSPHITKTPRGSQPSTANAKLLCIGKTSLLNVFTRGWFSTV